MVDRCDLPLVKSYNWLLNKKHYGYVYVYRYVRMENGTYRHLRMPHHILGRPEIGKVWDHKNGNTLDNRRSNLRQITQRQNMQNSRVRHIKDRPIKPKSSRYKGVSYSLVHKKDHLTKPWRSRIRVNGVLIGLGWFDNEKDAAIAYNSAAEKYFGEFASLNEV